MPFVGLCRSNANDGSLLTADLQIGRLWYMRNEEKWGDFANVEKMTQQIKKAFHDRYHLVFSRLLSIDTCRVGHYCAPVMK